MSKAIWVGENLKPGEVYAGILLGVDDEPDQHIILLPGEAEGIKWADASKWAKKAGGDLPTRREQSLLFANAKKEFQPHWYWSSEQRAAGSAFAWIQDFLNGSQLNDHKSYEGRARAVRRLTIS